MTVDIDGFPAFLSRRDDAIVRPWLEPLEQISRKVRFIEWLKARGFPRAGNTGEMSMASIQEVPSGGRPARIQQPAIADIGGDGQEDQRLIGALSKPLEAIRAILGERVVNSVLHNLLRQSNAKLESYGVRQPDHESAELESLRAQLKAARDANANGSAEYRDVVAENEQLRAALRDAQAAA